MVNDFDTALTLATAAHRGMKDKGGKPYIMHPLRVMANVETMEEKIVALLHDTIEDSKLTIHNLREAGFSDEILVAVKTLTRQKDEDYDDYIDRVKDNDLARAVKMADLIDNSNLSRLKNVTEADTARFDKYQRAISILANAATGSF